MKTRLTLIALYMLLKENLVLRLLIEEFNSQITKILKDNANDFKNIKNLTIRFPLRLADLNNLTINDENSHNLLVELANAGIGEANRLLKLRFFQAMVLSDYNEAVEISHMKLILLTMKK